MEPNKPMSLTAVFLKNRSGYTGFVVELPGVNAHGRNIVEAREALQNMVALVFEEERRGIAEILIGKEVLREVFAMPLVSCSSMR
jgi:predicted RNase H-like HicB family nuclease